MLKDGRMRVSKMWSWILQFTRTALFYHHAGRIDHHVVIFPSATFVVNFVNMVTTLIGNCEGSYLMEILRWANASSSLILRHHTEARLNTRSSGFSKWIRKLKILGVAQTSLKVMAYHPGQKGVSLLLRFITQPFLRAEAAQPCVWRP